MADVKKVFKAYTNGTVPHQQENGMENGKSEKPEIESDKESDDDDFDNCSDPEIRAELAFYAKNKQEQQGGMIDPNALPLRQKLRLLRRIKSVEEPPKQVNGVVQVSRGQKNQRKTRAGKGRGLAKKGGNGGKWTWGQSKTVYEEEPEFLDSNDPNYDSDANNKQKEEKYKAIAPELGEAMMEKYVEPIVLEFFENDDMEEALESIDELRLSKNARPRVVRLAITLSMDRKASAREMTSQLIAELAASRILSNVDVERGFVALLNTDLPDLVLDYPNAAEIVGNFLARAAADEALPPEFTLASNVDKETWSNEFAKSALDRAEVMIANKYRLDTIWGVGGGARPVRFLVTKIKQLLDEYLSSGDAVEAARCLQELEVPHFHHELVFQAGVVTIEAMHERTARMLATLLSELCAQSILTTDTVRTGFQRLYDALPDLCLDVPPAYTLLERWMVACGKTEKPFLPEDVIRKMPQKGRKRFVSEGDGGRLKVVDVPHPYL